MFLICQPVKHFTGLQTVLLQFLSKWHVESWKMIPLELTPADMALNWM